MSNSKKKCSNKASYIIIWRQHQFICPACFLFSILFFFIESITEKWTRSQCVRKWTQSPHDSLFPYLIDNHVFHVIYAMIEWALFLALALSMRRIEYENSSYQNTLCILHTITTSTLSSVDDHILFLWSLIISVKFDEKKTVFAHK